MACERRARLPQGKREYILGYTDMCCLLRAINDKFKQAIAHEEQLQVVMSARRVTFSVHNTLVTPVLKEGDVFDSYHKSIEFIFRRAYMS